MRARKRWLALSIIVVGCSSTNDDVATTDDATTDTAIVLDSVSFDDTRAGDTLTNADARDAATPDVLVETPPADPCAGRLVCDDFEKGTVGAKPGAPWSIAGNKGTALLDATRAYSGKQSVKVAIDATTSTDTYRRAMLNISGAPLVPVPGNSFYGRFMIWTDRIPDAKVHWTIAHADGPQGTLTATYNYGGMGGLMANYYRNTAPKVTDCWQTKAQTFPTNAWTCVAYQYDGKNNEMRFWLDGKEIPELHVVGNTKDDSTCTEKGIDGKWYAPTFKNVSVGWESYQHDVAGAHAAWIDDVILDDAPIACP
jgi:hypothetical protein